MKYVRWGTAVLVVVGLFFVYSWCAWNNWASHAEYSRFSPKFDTPDETIHYFYATHFAKTGSLTYHELLNAQFTNPIIFMRWMQSPGVGSDKLFPGTFLGFIILAGVVAKVFGAKAILFLTPLLAVGCVALMYWGVRQVFDSKIAAWSAAILALLPPFAYYSERTMFNTVPFVFFVLLGVAAYLRATNSRVQDAGKVDGYFIVLSALGFASALWIRFADIWWIGLTVLMLLVARPVRWRQASIFVAIVACGAAGVLVMNRAVYGSWMSFGYPIPGFSASAATPPSQDALRFFLPFGFHPRAMWYVFVHALWQPYWEFMVLTGLGLVTIAVRYWRTHRNIMLILVGYLFLTRLYVVSLYGSWPFSDSPTPGLVTIGSSYTRYFLPLLVMAVPFAGYLIASGLSAIRLRTARVAVAVVVVALLGGQTWALAYAGKEGLQHVAAQRESYDATTVAIENNGARPEDIFLVHRGEDKMLFPQFPRVINVDYLPADMVRENLEHYSGTVWFSQKDHVFVKKNPYAK